MADAPQPKIFDQFSKLIGDLSAYESKQAIARANSGQPVWFEPATSITSRQELLQNVSREELNEAFKQACEKGADTSAATGVIIALQHDFLAGVARDMFHVRRPRLARLYARIAADNGLGSSQGILQAGVLATVQQLKDLYSQ